MADTSPQKSPAEAVEDILALVRSVLRRSKRYWPVLAVSVIFAALAAWLAPQFRPPVYQSEVVLQFREGLDSRSSLALQTPTESSRNRNSRLREFFFSAPTLTELVASGRIGLDSVSRLGMPRVNMDLRQQIQFCAGAGTNIGITSADPDPRVARRLEETLLRHENAAIAERAAANAAAAGLFALPGGALMLGLGFLDRRIPSEWDLAKLKLAPVSVAIPRIDDGKPSAHG